MKKTMILLILLLMILPACSKAEEPVQTPAQEEIKEEVEQAEKEAQTAEEAARKAREEAKKLEEEQKKAEEALKKAEEEAKKMEEELEKLRKEAEVISIGTVLKEGYSSWGHFNYEDETQTFRFQTTDPNLLAAVPFVKRGLGLDQWQNIVDSFVSFSEHIRAEYAAGYTIEVDDPEETGKILLSVKDGKALYNLADD